MPTPITKGAPAATPEQALSKLLSFEQLTELAVLISNITESMHKQIADSFEASISASHRGETHQRLSKNSRNPNIEELKGPVHQESEDEIRARRLQERRERDLPDQGLQDLKNDALEYFQAWRDGIVSKIMDATNSKDDDDGQGQDGTSPSPDRQEAPDLKVLGMLLCYSRCLSFRALHFFICSFGRRLYQIY